MSKSRKKKIISSEIVALYWLGLALDPCWETAPVSSSISNIAIYKLDVNLHKCHIL
jgi:hypothetical protein